MFLWLMLGAGVGCMRPRSRSAAQAPAYAVTPRLVRPVVLVAAAAIFALVVMPSATLTAHASNGYNDDSIEEVAVATTLGLFLGYWLFGLGDTGVAGAGAGATGGGTTGGAVTGTGSSGESESRNDEEKTPADTTVETNSG